MNQDKIVNAVNTPAYTFFGIGLLFAYLSNAKSRRRDKIVSRMFLKSSLDEVRLENANGDYVDIAIDKIVLTKTIAQTAVLRIKIDKKQYAEMNLKDASYFDPELLYAITHPDVSRIVTSR